MPTPESFCGEITTKILCLLYLFIYNKCVQNIVIAISYFTENFQYLLIKTSGQYGKLLTWNTYIENNVWISIKELPIILLWPRRYLPVLEKNEINVLSSAQNNLSPVLV